MSLQLKRSNAGSRIVGLPQVLPIEEKAYILLCQAKSTSIQWHDDDVDEPDYTLQPTLGIVEDEEPVSD